MYFSAMETNARDYSTSHLKAHYHLCSFHVTHNVFLCYKSPLFAWIYFNCCFPCI